MDNEGTFDPPRTAGDDYEAHQLATLADELIDQIGAARRHYADLRAAIDGAEAAPAPPAPAPVAIEEREAVPVAQHGGYHRTPEEEAEIVALGMALNGGSRDEAHMHIAETFGIYDTDEILDRAFGAHFQH